MLTTAKRCNAEIFAGSEGLSRDRLPGQGEQKVLSTYNLSSC